MTKTVASLLFAVVAATGCVPDAGLARLDGKTLTLYANSIEDDPPTVTVTIWLHSEGPCPVALADLRGTVNGVPLEVRSFGYSEPQGVLCGGISLNGPRPDPGPLDVRVWDSSGEITATFANPFEERTLTLLEPSDGTLYVGDQVHMRYTPATDVLEPLFYGEPIAIDGPSWLAPLSRSGDTLSFVVPESFTTQAGPAELTLTAKATVPALTCVGVRSCTVEPGGFPKPVPVTLVNDLRGNASCYECGCTCPDGKTNWFRRGEGEPVPCSAIACMTTCLDTPAQSFSCRAHTPAEVTR